MLNDYCPMFDRGDILGSTVRCHGNEDYDEWDSSIVRLYGYYQDVQWYTAYKHTYIH